MVEAEVIPPPQQLLFYLVERRVRRICCPSKLVYSFSCVLQYSECSLKGVLILI